MPTKTRLPNKTIWSLEDIIAASIEARRAWRKAMDRAENRMDPVMIAALARLSDALATIESKARAARRGEYHE